MILSVRKDKRKSFFLQCGYDVRCDKTETVSIGHQGLPDIVERRLRRLIAQSEPCLAHNHLAESSDWASVSSIVCNTGPHCMVMILSSPSLRYGVAVRPRKCRAWILLSTASKETAGT